MAAHFEDPQVIVLGGGLGVAPSGETILLPNSQARADRAIALYNSNPEVFKRAGSVIICTGRSTELSDEAFLDSEASMLANALLAAGVPDHLIETEDRSKNTLTNFLNSSPILREKSAKYSGDSEPVLSVVTQGWHYSPRAHYLGSVTLNKPMRNEPALGVASLRRKGQEAVLYAWYRHMLRGVVPGDIPEIRRRSDARDNFVQMMRTPASKLWE